MFKIKINGEVNWVRFVADRSVVDNSVMISAVCRQYEERRDGWEDWYELTIDLDSNVPKKANEAFLDVETCPIELVDYIMRKHCMDTTNKVQRYENCDYPIVSFSEKWLDMLFA